MLVVTGAAGFIGSCLVKRLLDNGLGPIVAVDDFANPSKHKNTSPNEAITKVDRFEFIKNPGLMGKPDFIFHIGARTDTAEFDVELLKKLNTDYTKQLWTYCSQNNIPFIYASSAATYGLAQTGFDDNTTLLDQLEPLNPYGHSKHEFDLWAIKQSDAPPFWAGLKFFNVFGPNEYHKERMASVVMHGTSQIQKSGTIKLFKSHNPHYEDGCQLRDFIYVEDVLDVILYLYQRRPKNDIYNLGTGKARSWNDLAKAIFAALGKPVNIEYIDIPIDIRQTYQYFTEANMQKLINTGYTKEFTSLECAVEAYIKLYLLPNLYY